jgi:sensor histidine kinase YesM
MFLKLKNSSVLKFAIHVTVWLIVFALPFILSTEENFSWDIYSRGPWLPIIFAVVTFYFNFFLLIDKFLLKKKYLIFFLINILIIVGFIFLLDYIRFLTMHAMPDFDPENIPDRPPDDDSMFLEFAIKDFFTMGIPLIFCVAIKVTRKLTNTEREKQQIEKENIRSTLMLLKYQVQPHFFFNSLNNIYALIESSPKNAQEALYNLGKLMRYLLYEKEFVRLDEEIDFLKKYISLMELRLRDNIKMRVTFPDNTEKYQVSPLLFIPLIENAYKHGISSTESSIIFIEMRIEKNRLHFIVENTYFPKDESDKSGSGIGLQNLKQRLNLIYKDKYSLLQNIENGIFRIELIIDLP